jgi:hypothetical protein
MGRRLGMPGAWGAPGNECASVAVAEAVFVAAEFAEGRRLGIVYIVIDGLNGSQVGEDGFEVVVGHVAKITVGHERIQFANAAGSVAGANGLDEHIFVVVADTTGMKSDVGGNNVAPRTG